MKLAPPYDLSVQIFPGTPARTRALTSASSALLAARRDARRHRRRLLDRADGSGNFTFELPAIVELDGGYAHLVDGWQVPFAETIDRSECESPAESFSEFLRIVGTEHRSRFSIGEGAITDVTC